MNSPHTVVFDLGKVLLDFDYTKVVERLAQAGPAHPAEVRRTLLESSWLLELESGQLDSQSFYQRLRQTLQLNLDYQSFRDAFGDIFTPIPDMIAAQAALRARNIPTFILSNTNEIAVSHIRQRYPFFHQFNGHILSHEIGALKPAAAIYQALETQAGRRGTDLFYLDDLAENLAAAAQRGWQTALHTSPQSSIQLLRAAGFPV